MDFAIHRPRGRLARYVESLTCFSGYAPAHAREKLIPDGAIQIIVDLSERPKKLYAGETGAVAVDFRKAWISGMQRRWIVIEAQPGSSLLVIRFRPGAVRAFAGHDAASLTDAVFPLVDVMGETGSLRDRVLEAADHAGRFAAAEGWLNERLDPSALDPLVERAAARLARPFGLSVRGVAEAAGISERQLRNLFLRDIGVGPKQFARIGRFQQVLGALSGGRAEAPFLDGEPLPDPDWAALAAATGFSDQSHLSHEFMAFAGMTPGAYAASFRGLGNYLPIGRSGA